MKTYFSFLVLFISASIDLKHSIFIGDKNSDITAAFNAEIPTAILVRSGHEIDEHNTNATFIANDVSHALLNI